MKKPSTIVTKDEIQNGVEDEFGVVYSKDGTRLLCCKEIFLPEYIVKEGTLVICDNAFQPCECLNYINLPNTVTTIGQNALGYGVETIVLPSSLKFIEEDAIGVSTSLYYVVVPEGKKNKFKRLLPKQLWEYMCTMNEMRENFPLNVPCEFWQILSVPNVDGKFLKKGIGIGMPEKMRKLYPTFTVSNGVEIIEASAFSLDNCFETIFLPDSLVEIQELAFYNCKMLKNIVLPKSLKKIGTHAFENCESLCELTIPASVEEIGDNPFKGCKNLRLKSESKRFVVKDGILIDIEKHIFISCTRCFIYQFGGNNWSCAIWYAKQTYRKRQSQSDTHCFNDIEIEIV